MDRIVITNMFHGICHMQVCAESNVTDKEILAVCNEENPAGTEEGWSHVIRNSKGEPHSNPIPCDDHVGRIHFLIEC